LESNKLSDILLLSALSITYLNSKKLSHLFNLLTLKK